MRILVTGATGQLGSRVVATVLERVPPEEVAVSVRNPEKAHGLRAHGIDVRRGDFEDPASLDRAFAGIERLLLVSTDGDNETRLRQHRNAVAAAARAGVRFIAYTSLARAQSSPLGLGVVHRETEAAIRATGIPCSMLRNNWYLENEVGSIRGAVAGAPVITAAGNGRIGWVSRADLAEAAAVVLTGGGHENTVYELSGPPRTYEEFAQAIGEVLGREVRVQHVDLTGYQRILDGFALPHYLLELLVDTQRGMRQGALDVESEHLEQLLGRPPASLKENVALTLAAAGCGRIRAQCRR